MKADLLGKYVEITADTGSDKIGYVIRPWYTEDYYELISSRGKALIVAGFLLREITLEEYLRRIRNDS